MDAQLPRRYILRAAGSMPCLDGQKIVITQPLPASGTSNSPSGNSSGNSSNNGNSSNSTSPAGYGY